MQDYTLEPQDTRHRRRASGGPRGGFPADAMSKGGNRSGDRRHGHRGQCCGTCVGGKWCCGARRVPGVVCRRIPGAKGIDARAVDPRDAQAVAEALTGVQRVFLATPLEKDMAAVAARVVEQACRAGSMPETLPRWRVISPPAEPAVASCSCRCGRCQVT